MLKTLALVALLAFAPSAAFAEARATKEIKLSVEQSLALLDVLTNRMDSYQRTENDGDKSRVVVTYYKLDLPTRMAMAKNITVLRYVAEAYERQRNNSLMEVSAGKGTLASDTPEGARFNIANRDLLSREQALNLFVLSESDLRLKDNPFPAPVLAALLPILAATE